MKELKDNFKAAVKANPFGVMPNNTITAEVRNIQSTLSIYRIDQTEADLSLVDWLNLLTPEFQRANNKWTEEMQVSFVENMVSGFKSTILMYTVGDDGLNITDAFLLDGLQRLTAWTAFMMGEFKIFGQFYFNDINTRSILGRSHMVINFYNFNDHKEACEFYISMNKNITHSPQDLEVAYEFLKSQ
jgi:hypothetical protein